MKAIGFFSSSVSYSDCYDCRQNIFHKFTGKKNLRFYFNENARKSRLTTVRLISLCDRSINRVNVDLYSGHGSEIASNFDTTKYPLDKLDSLAVDNIDIDFDRFYLTLAYDTAYTSALQFCCGIWLLPSFINHSCIPNVVKLFIGDICIVRAITDIAEGDEIFCSYVPLDLFHTVESRKEFLKFTCNCKLCKFEKNPDFLHIIFQLNTMDSFLSTVVAPHICEANILHQEIQNAIKQTISRDKWLEIRNKLFDFAKILRLKETNHCISFAFLHSILCLLRVNFSPQDILELALEAEPYFSTLEPITYVTFWNSFYRILKKLGKLKHPLFQHVEKKYNQTQELFT